MKYIYKLDQNDMVAIVIGQNIMECWKLLGNGWETSSFTIIQPLYFKAHSEVLFIGKEVARL